MEDFMFADGLVSENELEHIGKSVRDGAKVGSGRYRWGSGENPYHHGASAPHGFRAKLREKRRAKEVAARTEKMRAAKAEKAEKARREAAQQVEHEAKKREAISSGDPSKIAPYINEMSNDELQAVTKRLELELNLKDVMLRKDPSFGKSKTDKAIAALDKLNRDANTVIGSYNTVARVLNAVNGASLPIIPRENGGQNNKNDKNKNKGKS